MFVRLYIHVSFNASFYHWNFAHSSKEYLFTNKNYEPIVYCNVMIIYNPVSNDDLVALLLVEG